MKIRSDVFDNFVKIAQEKGMISRDPDKTKKMLEKNPRADSLDISAIEALYGVKPNLPKDMEYENNIMEDAHPNSVVISPSYDKLNGLVENNVEKQNILLHIVNKTPDGLLTQRKYAEQEFLLSLVSIANDLDNKNQDGLRALADTCLSQASQSTLKKKAQDPITLGLIGVVALLGGLYLQQHLRMISDGFERDYQKLIAEIDDLINSNDSLQTQLGGGYSYKPDFIREMQNFKSKLNKYYGLFKRIEPLIERLEKPRTASELLEQAQQPETQELIKGYEMFRAATDELLPYIEAILKNFSNESYKQHQITEKGTFMGLLDAPQVLHGGKGLVADDFDDVARALKTFVVDIQNIMKSLQSADSFKQSALNDIRQSAYKSQELFGGGPDKGDYTTAPFTPPNKTPSPGTFVSAPGTTKDIDNEAEALSSLLEGAGVGI